MSENYLKNILQLFSVGAYSVKFIEYFPGVTLAEYVASNVEKAAQAQAGSSWWKWSPDFDFISTAMEVVRQLLETVRLKVDIFRFEFFCFVVR